MVDKLIKGSSNLFIGHFIYNLRQNASPSIQWPLTTINGSNNHQKHCTTQVKKQTIKQAKNG